MPKSVEPDDYSSEGGDIEIDAGYGVHKCFVNNEVLIYTVVYFPYVGCHMLFSKTRLKVPDGEPDIVPEKMCVILRKQRNCPRSIEYTPPPKVLGPYGFLKKD